LNFFYKMHNEKLYKNCMIELLFICSNGISYIQNEQPTWQFHLPCLKDFFVLHMSRLRKMIEHWIFFKKMYRRKLYKNCMKQFLYWTRKVFQTFSIRSKVTLSCRLFILSIRKITSTDKKEFNHVVFIELFTAHLTEKNSRFYHLPKPRYTRNKKVLQHYEHLVL
jgi:hypothetical protein